MKVLNEMPSFKDWIADQGKIVLDKRAVLEAKKESLRNDLYIRSTHKITYEHGDTWTRFLREIAE